MDKQRDLVSDLKNWADLELEFGNRLKATRINNIAIKYFNKLSLEDKCHVIQVIKANHIWWRHVEDRAEIIRKEFFAEN